MTKKKDIVQRLLDLEDEVREAALNYPEGPNSDAPKNALAQVAQRIGGLRNALTTNEAVAR